MDLNIKMIYWLDSFPFVFAYMLLVLLAGQWKKYSKPLELRLILVVYNLSISALNLFTAISFFHGLCNAESSFDLRPSEFMKPAFKVHWTLKTIKLFDTVILTLRHKQHQIIFYHIFNHLGLLILSDLGYNYYPLPALAWYAGPVCLGHVMYHFYFAIHAMYPGNRPSWKKALKHMDIVEFSIHFVHATIGYLYYNYCIYGVLYTLTNASLVCRDYYKTYMTKVQFENGKQKKE